MICRFWRWLTEVEPERKPVPTEAFGKTVLDASRGLALLSDAKRRSTCQAIREMMSAFPLEAKGEFVDRLFLRFALYVMDLQASEKHHHAVPYGLLDHSLEVAYKVSRRLNGPALSYSEDPVLNYRDKPFWHYAAMICALFHDVGKVLDLEVMTPDGKDRWNPYAEPLALFCQRNGLTSTGPEYWRYRAGRGMRFHSWHGPMVFPLILPDKATSLLGHRLAAVSDAMIAETLDRVPEAPTEYATVIARLIHEMDIESSKADRTTPGAEDPSPALIAELPELKAAPPAPIPPSFETPVVREQLPPLDLGAVLRDFTTALRASVETGLIPVNKEGGLYIGRKHVYLHYPEGMTKVMELMITRGSDLQVRFQQDSEVNRGQSCGEFTPESRVFQSLLADHRMPYSTNEMAWIQQGEIAPPGGGKPWWGQVLLTNLPFQDLPLFQGTMKLDQIGDPESDSATNPLKPLRQEARPVGATPRPQEEAYEKRVEAELEPGRLLASLSEALWSGVFHRPGLPGPICIRPDFIWIMVPDTFKILLPRMGIRFTEELENRILRSIAQMPEVARGEDGRSLLRIKIHPDAATSVWAFSIKTRSLLTPEHALALGTWKYPIRVIEDPAPGEYAA